MRDGPGCVFNGGFYWGQEAKGWWGVRSYRRIRNQAHASSFLQVRRLRSVWLGASLFIPAHAGNTDRYLHGMGVPEAHPRGCGENPMGTTSHTHDNGSSPAHTGNTDAWQLAGFSTWAHPRAYGENNAYALRTGLIQGSSPRIRGKPQNVVTEHGTSGLIPAHTGKTSSRRLHQPDHRAHPRAYGERLPIADVVVTHEGSSPRIRGTPCGASDLRPLVGLIPAHTGNAPSRFRYLYL